MGIFLTVHTLRGTQVGIFLPVLPERGTLVGIIPFYPEREAFWWVLFPVLPYERGLLMGISPCFTLGERPPGGYMPSLYTLVGVP